MASRRAVIDRQAIVVAFDMCSSSNIIDDLTKSGNVGRLPVFFTAIERYLAARQIDAVPFHPYKFTGGGRVLVFPDRTDGAKLLRFLEGACHSPSSSAARCCRVYRASPRWWVSRSGSKGAS